MLTRGKQLLRTSLMNNYPVEKRKRNPLQDAKWWVEAGLDKDGMQLRYINDYKGYGVFAEKPFQKGEFLLEYVGEVISKKEALMRENKYRGRRSFLYFFKSDGDKCIDATYTTGRLGHMVNDAAPSDYACNSKMKLISCGKQPRLCLFSSRQIDIGEELLYDYGVDGLWWRNEHSMIFIQSSWTDSDRKDALELRSCSKFSSGHAILQLNGVTIYLKRDGGTTNKIAVLDSSSDDSDPFDLLPNPGSFAEQSDPENPVHGFHAQETVYSPDSTVPLKRNISTPATCASWPDGDDTSLSASLDCLMPEIASAQDHLSASAALHIDSAACSSLPDDMPALSQDTPTCALSHDVVSETLRKNRPATCASWPDGDDTSVSASLDCLMPETACAQDHLSASAALHIDSAACSSLPDDMPASSQDTPTCALSHDVVSETLRENRSATCASWPDGDDTSVSASLDCLMPETACAQDHLSASAALHIDSTACSSLPDDMPASSQDTPTCALSHDVVSETLRENRPATCASWPDGDDTSVSASLDCLMPETACAQNHLSASAALHIDSAACSSLPDDMPASSQDTPTCALSHDVVSETLPENKPGSVKNVVWSTSMEGKSDPMVGQEYRIFSWPVDVRLSNNLEVDIIEDSNESSASLEFPLLSSPDSTVPLKRNISTPVSCALWPDGDDTSVSASLDCLMPETACAQDHLSASAALHIDSAACSSLPDDMPASSQDTPTCALSHDVVSETLPENKPGKGHDKKHYSKPGRPCPFCTDRKLHKQLKRHITRRHKDLPEVKHALSLPREKQLLAFDRFRKQGIYNINMHTLKFEEDAPVYLCERVKQKDNLVKCTVCNGFYSAKYFSRHKSKCRVLCQTLGSAPSTSAGSIPHKCPIAIPTQLLEKNEEDPEFTEKILARFDNDHVGNLCRSDDVLIMIGKRLWDKQKKKGDKKQEVRKNVMSIMRILAHLFLQFKTQLGSEKGVENICGMFKRCNFRALEAAIVSYTSHDCSGDCFGSEVKAGLKKNLYYHITKAAKIVHATLLMDSCDELAKEVEQFLTVFELHKSFLFGDADYIIQKGQQTRLRKPEELPVESEVKKLRNYIVKRMEEMLSDKYQYWTEAKFVELRRLAVARLTLFNGRRGGEPSRLSLQEWAEAENEVWLDKNRLENITDPLEKRLLKETKIAYQSGKGNNRLVSILITSDTAPALRILSDKEVRNSAGVHPYNQYLFALTQHSECHVSGWQCVQDVCESAKVDGQGLIARKMRHRVSTLYEMLDVPSEERRWFYTHMGHSERINRDIYQSPLAIMAVTKVGKHLHQMDQGFSTAVNTEVESGKEDSDCEEEIPQKKDSDCEEEIPQKRRKLPRKSRKGDFSSGERGYFRWSKEVTKKVKSDFMEWIHLPHGNLLPSKKIVVDYMEKHKLGCTYQQLRTKIMNEQNKQQALIKKRCAQLNIAET